MFRNQINSRLRYARAVLVEGGVPSRIHTKVVGLAIAMIVVLSFAPQPALAQTEGEKDSPPGQIYVWTVNARQQLAVDLKAFRRLYELVKAVRVRPSAFDGGVTEATAMPDVMMFNEMRFANLEIFRRLLLQRSKFGYEIVSAEGAEDKLLYNSETVTPQGPPQTIVDPCRSGGDNARQYLAQRFTENATGSVFTVVAVHLKARYEETGQPQCRERNIQAIKTAVTADAGPVVIGGDFNKRPVEVEAACDPNEQSASLEWYRMLTEPADLTRAFIDTVRDVHRAQNESMASDWTFERLARTTLCNGATTYKRSRLDYIFAAGALVAEAHTDHPGWSDSQPGKVPFGKERYSDHRWVWARLVLTPTPRPSAPAVELGAGGTVDLTWEPVEGATGYVVYRAKKWHSFSQVGTVPADQTTYTDTATHGTPFRYAVAAVGADAGQSRESPGVRVIPDARGPRVTATDPPNGSPGVHPRVRVRAWFSEGVNPLSVDGSTIEIFRNGHRVPGRVRRESARQITFNPAGELRKGNRYYVVVRPVTDRLGNRGARHSFWFTTPEPSKKDRQRR